MELTAPWGWEVKIIQYKKQEMIALKPYIDVE